MIEISAERVAHEKAVILAEELFKTYGIRVDQVAFKWEEDGDVDEPGFRLKSISMATTTT